MEYVPRYEALPKLGMFVPRRQLGPGMDDLHRVLTALWWCGIPGDVDTEPLPHCREQPLLQWRPH